MLFVDEPWYDAELDYDKFLNHMLHSRHDDTVEMFVELLELCIELIQAPTHEAQIKHDQIWATVLPQIQDAELELIHASIMECLDDDISACSTDNEESDHDESDMTD